MHNSIIKIFITVIPVFTLHSNFGNVQAQSQEEPAEPAFQIFSRQPPNDAVSVTWKASRPTVPSMADEFGSHDNAYVCNYGGVWIAYREPNFNDGWLTNDVKCNSVWYANNNVNSVMLLESSKNFSIPTINLYPKKGWSGLDGMLTTTEDQPVLTHFNSFIATGITSITFYQGYNYEFRPICVKADVGSYVVNHSDLAYIGLGSAGVKSFRFGCFAPDVIYLNDIKELALNVREFAY